MRLCVIVYSFVSWFLYSIHIRPCNSLSYSLSSLFPSLFRSPHSLTSFSPLIPSSPYPFSLTLLCLSFHHSNTLALPHSLTLILPSLPYSRLSLTPLSPLLSSLSYSPLSLAPPPSLAPVSPLTALLPHSPHPITHSTPLADTLIFPSFTPPPFSSLSFPLSPFSFPHVNSTPMDEVSDSPVMAVTP